MFSISCNNIYRTVTNKIRSSQIRSHIFFDEKKFDDTLDDFTICAAKGMNIIQTPLFFSCLMRGYYICVYIHICTYIYMYLKLLLCLKERENARLYIYFCHFYILIYSLLYVFLFFLFYTVFKFFSSRHISDILFITAPAYLSSNSPEVKLYKSNRRGRTFFFRHFRSLTRFCSCL